MSNSSCLKIIQNLLGALYTLVHLAHFPCTVSVIPLYNDINFIYSFIAQLYNCITLTIHRKCTKCTRLLFVKDYNRLWVIPLFFLSLMNFTYMSCTLFNSHMEIPIFSPIMIFGEKNLTVSHPPSFQLNHWKYS